MASKVHKARLQLAESVLKEMRRRPRGTFNTKINIPKARIRPRLSGGRVQTKDAPEPPGKKHLNISQDARDALQRARGSTNFRKDNANINPKDPLTKYAMGAEKADWKDATNLLAKEFKAKKGKS